MKSVKVLAITISVLGPMVVTMVLGDIHPGYIVSNALWIILVALKLRQG